MRKVRIGFVPLHRPPRDEDWAVHLKNRFVKVAADSELIDLVYPDEDLTKWGLVSSDEDADKVIELFKKNDVDGIILGTMTFGDEIAGFKIAEEFRNIPLMVFGTKEPEPLPGGFRKSDSFCGTLSLTSGLFRRKIPFIFGGIIFPEEDNFKKTLEDFARTCMIVRRFVGARIGLIGSKPERFEPVVFNEAAMVYRFKHRVLHESLLKIIEEARKIKESDEDLIKILEEIKSTADVSEVPEEALVKMARLEVVLRRLIREKKLSAVAVRCWLEIEQYYGISPCFILGRLTESGMLASCEADVYGALTMLIQYSAALESTPPHFIDWTIKHPEHPDIFLAWHCGNAPPILVHPKSKVRIREHNILYRFVGVEKSYGTGEFRLKPGVVTICRLIERDGEFKMLITKGEVLDMEMNYRGSGGWVRVRNLNELYETLVKEGFVHHASMIYGDYVKPIEQACYLLGIKVVKV